MLGKKNPWGAVTTLKAWSILKHDMRLAVFSWDWGMVWNGGEQSQQLKPLVFHSTSSGTNVYDCAIQCFWCLGVGNGMCCIWLRREPAKKAVDSSCSLHILQPTCRQQETYNNVMLLWGWNKCEDMTLIAITLQRKQMKGILATLRTLYSAWSWCQCDWWLLHHLHLSSWRWNCHQATLERQPSSLSWPRMSGHHWKHGTFLLFLSSLPFPWL